jgi:hypothetical protein
MERTEKVMIKSRDEERKIAIFRPLMGASGETIPHSRELLLGKV